MKWPYIDTNQNNEKLTHANTGQSKETYPYANTDQSKERYEMAYVTEDKDVVEIVRLLRAQKITQEQARMKIEWLGRFLSWEVVEALHSAKV